MTTNTHTEPVYRTPNDKQEKTLQRLEKKGYVLCGCYDYVKVWVGFGNKDDIGFIDREGKFSLVEKIKTQEQ